METSGHLFSEIADSNNAVNSYEFKLWNILTRTEIVLFKEAMCPVFTLDGLHLLYIDVKSDKSLIVYTLENMGPLLHISCNADLIMQFSLAIPACAYYEKV